MKRMKKLSAILIVPCLFLLLNGCSSLFVREQEARDIVKNYIQTSLSDGANITSAEYIASEQSGCVVSIASTYYITQNGKRQKFVFHTSGIVINSEGYILTSSETAASIDGVSPSSITATLAPVYNDDSAYRLVETDRDEDCGLALFRFYDSFYRKTESGEKVKGLQFNAEFSSVDVNTGDRCWAAGNSLGDIFENTAELSVTGGTVADNAADSGIFSLSMNGKNYEYMIATAPICPEMLGGALFDKNGYLIGMAASKIVSSDENQYSYEYLNELALFYKTDILIDYVDTVSESLQTVIPLTVASISEEA